MAKKEARLIVFWDGVRLGTGGKRWVLQGRVGLNVLHVATA